MSELSPSTNVREIRKGPVTMSASATAIGGFLGCLEKGPLTATLVTSPEDKKELFGDTPVGASLMEDVLEDFWANGGGSCYLKRILGSGYASAQRLLKASTAGSTNGASASAVGTTTVALVDGDTITPKIDTVAQGLVTIAAKRASITGAGATYAAVTAGHTLDLEIQGVAQSITFAGTENDELSYLTTIGAQLVGASATLSVGELKIICDIAGSSSDGEVMLSSDADVLAALGLAAGAFTIAPGSNVADVSKVTWTELKVLLDASVGLTATVTVTSTKITVTTVTAGVLGSVQFAPGGTITAKISADEAIHYGLGTAPVSTLQVDASSPGAWGNEYSVLATRVDTLATKLGTSYLAAAVTSTLLVASVSRIFVGDTLSITNGGGTVRAVVTKVDGYTVTLSAALTVPAGGWSTATSVINETFSLAVYDKDGKLERTFSNCRISSTAGTRFVENIVNNASRTPILATVLGSAASDKRPLTDTTPGFLAAGTDGNAPVAADYVGSLGAKTGLYAFNKATDVNLIAVPGSADDVVIVSGMETYGELRNDVIMVFDAPSGMDESAIKTWVTTTTNLATSYGAIFAPHGYKLDKVTGAKKLVPPCGVFQGIYARTHRTRNFGKAAAGIIDGKINGWLGLEYEFSEAEYDVLYPVKVNCILNFPGEGMAMWGNRTLDPTGEFGALTKRTIFNAAKRAIKAQSHNVSFEGNNPTTRQGVVRRLSSLFREWRQADPPILQGATDSEAFFIQCDENNNTALIIDQDKFVCRVGLADSKASEFQDYTLETDTRAIDAALASLT